MAQGLIGTGIIEDQQAQQDLAGVAQRQTQMYEENKMVQTANQNAMFSDIGTGAGVGLSVGGPWGAAIGAGVGLLYGLGQGGKI